MSSDFMKFSEFLQYLRDDELLILHVGNKWDDAIFEGTVEEFRSDVNNSFWSCEVMEFHTRVNEDHCIEDNKVELYSELLVELYDVDCKVIHGDDEEDELL